MLMYLKMIEVSVANRSTLVRRCNTDLHLNYITRVCALFIIFTNILRLFVIIFVSCYL